MGKGKGAGKTRQFSSLIRIPMYNHALGEDGEENFISSTFRAREMRRTPGEASRGTVIVPGVRECISIMKV
jgi:hypothetical protein